MTPSRETGARDTFSTRVLIFIFFAARVLNGRAGKNRFRTSIFAFGVAPGIALPRPVMSQISCLMVSKFGVPGTNRREYAFSG